VLPWLIDVELRGLPVYVWETSIVEQFLSPLAYIQQVHPDTVGLRDLVSFRCSAWCLDPSALPPTKELWVTEPPVAAMDGPSVKRLLSYPIETRFSVLLGPGAPPPPPPPSHAGSGGGEGPSDRRRRRRPSSPTSSDSSATGDEGGGSRRRPVLERVGPSSSCVVHVVDSSSGVFMAASAPAVLPEPVAGSQEKSDVARGSPDAEPLGLADINLAAAANGLEGPIDGSPSMVSPTLVRFEVLEDLKLPSTGCVAPRPASHGPMDSPTPDL